MPLNSGAGPEPRAHESGLLQPDGIAEQPNSTGRRSRFWGLLLANFTFAVGVFLLVYPWMDAWVLNHFPDQFQSFAPSLPILRNLGDYWDEPAFRGAVSGLGAVNLWIALREMLGLGRTK